MLYGWNKVLCLLEVIIAECTPWNWIKLGVGISCREGFITLKSLWDSFLKLLATLTNQANKDKPHHRQARKE